MCVGLCSCDSSQTRSVSSYNWSLEFITDLDGNMLFSGSVHDDIPVLDLTLSFEEKSFILTDNTHKQEWTGTYSLEKIDNSSSKLGLTFENLEDFLAAMDETMYKNKDTRNSAQDWLQKVLDNYERHYGVRLQIPRWTEIVSKYVK